MGVKGFPTIKIVRPGKKVGRPNIEDYNGPRTAKGIVEAVVDKITNHVKKVTDKDIDDFLSTNNETAKAILFSEKGTTSALLKSIAIDFLDVVQVAQIRSKEAKANELFGIESYPSLVLLPGGDKLGLLYDGEMKKDAMVKFLSQAGSPNPDPAPEESKAKKAKKSDKTEKKASQETEESTSTQSTTTETPEPVKAAPAIPAITKEVKLMEVCLNTGAATCILAFVPSAHSEAADTALHSLSEIAFKHSRRRDHLFPFYEVHSDERGFGMLLQRLELSGEVEVIATNGKRGWWRHFEGSDFEQDTIEAWIDTIRMGEGVKTKIPAGIVIPSLEESMRRREEEKAEKAKKAEAAEKAETAETTETTEEAETDEVVEDAEDIEEVEEVEVKIDEEVKIEVGGEPESSPSFQGAEPTPEYTEPEEPVETPAETPAGSHDEL